MSINVSLSQLIFTGLLIGALGVYIAKKRSFNPYIAFILGFFFGLFGIVALFFFSAKKNTSTRKESQQKETEMEKIFSFFHSQSTVLWYYLDNNNAQQGPYSSHAIIEKWKIQEVQPSTYLWNETLKNWITLKELLSKQVSKLSSLPS